MKSVINNTHIIRVDGHDIALTERDKILFPGEHPIIKKNLIDYYRRIAPVMVPHMYNRPLSMQRFVHGITQEGFFQKDAPAYFPDWIAREKIKKQDGGMVHYVLCNNAATLVYLMNQLCLTSHIWLSRIDHLMYPDRMIFDLDPSPGITFMQIRRVARYIKEILENFELPTFIMTTGSRGVHVVVPLKPADTFDAVRAFAHEVASTLAAKYPELITIEIRKDKRGKRVFIDTLRNAWGQTGVAPYAVRALPGAPVATPVLWDEFFKKVTSSQKYTIKNIFRRVSRIGDVWHDIDAHAVSLQKAQKNHSS